MRQFNIFIYIYVHALFALYICTQVMFSLSVYMWFLYCPGSIGVVLHQNAGVLDQIQSCYHAEVINYVAENIKRVQVSLHWLLTWTYWVPFLLQARGVT
jgi:hypothetical protein